MNTPTDPLRLRQSTGRRQTALKGRQRAALYRNLKKVFGLRQLRDGQEAVIGNVIAKRSTLAIMPTGAGKSLCYQLPALTLTGHTVVVSPLISLMKDQADKLNEADVPAVVLNSTLSTSAEEEALQAIRDKKIQFIFTTPEQMTNAGLLDILASQPINLLVVDEAHCISHWGHDFRPAFLELGAARRALGAPPVLALTATANQQVIDDIEQQLGVSLDVINTGVYRDNLHFKVHQITRENERVQLALQAIADIEGSGIVYTATVKAATEMHRVLVESGESAAIYHGRLGARRRHEQQDAFMSGDARVMVATNAFGLGIDKPDIRFVVHLQLPPNLDAYYQEAGRAGRDGEASRCLLIYFHEDRRLRQFQQLGRYPAAEDVIAVVSALRRPNAEAVAESDQASGAKTAWISAKSLAEHLPVSKAKIQVGLHLLKQAGVIAQNRKRELRLINAIDDDAVHQLTQEYRERDDSDRSALEEMEFYARTGYCRWKVLLDHFGESDALERCGSCDNCVSPPSAQPLRRERETV
ncbi:MAG TPA: RecQ family ATP-dependent DNA helicase [Burkholderiaceae bacterium]|nr:RecQ family ATP-dependent DNA helicase [Burkholderiaceae bacterium]